MSDTPDYSTISRFRNSLLELKLYDRLFDEINKQLIKKGFIVRERAGAIIDATVIESANRPRKIIKEIQEDRKEDDNTNLIKEDKAATSEEAKKNSDNKLSENTTSHFEVEYFTDPDAMWLKKGKHSYFGYKGFAGANVDGFIINGLMTPANVSEISKFPDVLNTLNLPTGTPVLADKGYSSDKNREILKDLGLKDFIMQKAARGRKLTEYQIDRCRYRGLKKVNMEFKWSQVWLTT